MTEGERRARQKRVRDAARALLEELGTCIEAGDEQLEKWAAQGCQQFSRGFKWVIRSDADARDSKPRAKGRL